MTYDTVEIEDMDWNEELQAFTYQCPCGDLFQITMVRLCCAVPSASERELVAGRLSFACIIVTTLGELKYL
jgi:hypothetical protein